MAPKPNEGGVFDVPDNENGAIELGGLSLCVEVVPNALVVPNGAGAPNPVFVPNGLDVPNGAIVPNAGALVEFMGDTRAGANDFVGLIALNVNGALFGVVVEADRKLRPPLLNAGGADVVAVDPNTGEVDVVSVDPNAGGADVVAPNAGRVDVVAVDPNADGADVVPDDPNAKVLGVVKALVVESTGNVLVAVATIGAVVLVVRDGADVFDANVDAGD